MALYYKTHTADIIPKWHFFIRKIWQKFIAKCVEFFIKIWNSCVVKHNRYYKTRRLYYKMWELLQNAIFTTKRVGTKIDLKTKEEFPLKPKKWSCFRKSLGWKSFHHLPTRIAECVSEYIFFVSNKKKHIQTKSKKKLKKKEKQKKPKKKKRNKMLLLTIPVENLTRDHDIVWELTLCTFTYLISQQRESAC